MNTISPSIPSGVQLVLHTTSNNEWSDLPESAYLQIDAHQARGILDLIGLTQVFRDQVTRAGLVNPFYGISVGSGDLLPDFRLMHLPFHDDEAPDSDRPVVQLPDDFDVENVSAENEHRVECHRIEVNQGGVRFTALLRHGSDRLTTVELDREVIRTIAEGRNPNIPTAKLTTSTFN